MKSVCMTECGPWDMRGTDTCFPDGVLKEKAVLLFRLPPPCCMQREYAGHNTAGQPCRHCRFEGAAGKREPGPLRILVEQSVYTRERNAFLSSSFRSLLHIM